MLVSSLAGVASCTSIEPNSNYVVLVPMRHVAETWIVTPEPNPDGYRVRLGNQRYHETIAPLVAKNALTADAAIDAACNVAVNEVMIKGGCEAIGVPTCAHTLVGPQGRPAEIWMHVECAQNP